jgi:hypothetical protein
MYNIQTFYGWQTQYKCVMSTHKIFYEYTTNVSTFNHEIHNEHSVKRREPIHRARIFLLPFHIYCSKPNRRNQKQATLKITNKEKELSLHTVCRKDTL